MATLLRIAALVICSIIATGFLTFAVGESERASAEQVQSIDPAAAEERRERKSGPVREAVDDANDFLLAPFASVTDSRNVWVQHLVPTTLGLLLYGLGLMLLANYLPKPSRANSDWRTA
jgi:hypothetical protein